MRERSEEKPPQGLDAGRDERQQPTRAAESEAERTARHAAEAEKARVKAEDRRQRFLKAVKWKVKARLPIRGYLQGVYAATRASQAFQKAGFTLPQKVMDEVVDYRETHETSFTLTLRRPVAFGEGTAQLRYASEIKGKIGDGEITDIEGLTTATDTLVRLESSAEGPTGVTGMGGRLNLNDLQGFEQ